ncbi:bifunctional phosphoribosylaminoimidazolecarboxamide formyltransferase/IMP cyclohydrolase [Leptothoe sp. PORK10 BA2]|uniref:bifunctional phosphoribosylaminoimidazolecarboxamide formyltransferase/IMP cyclohydrolase n=1 Tax=Leptothoe sp. PORK10 BA2 TaxID=3110254 RepID=UPI002B201241|nr:bifunctional phosphoribosylaminoimidazolecarboxamide formyltransferase/IMP cyclohydrolase [Leptothoe sp. PORK10 BA2]MEA5463950.1 bifunctional phosphoribosylaminoimidazolecarboxamide formyltransferase/IMP cyclohydrolase [Leptothoe sp. PORK10 BA2]
MTRLALLSASDKTGIVDLAKVLVSDFDFDIISSGGTARTLTEAGIPVTKVSDYTGFPEILGGRVKTLQPRIHGGILARTDNLDDQKDLADNDIRPIDLVVVNLYPFEQTVANPDTILSEAIEKIDIGGPTMLRSAAKNHAYLTVLCDPTQYEGYLNELRANNGQPSLEFRASCARQVFWHTATYDQAIATYLTEQAEGATSERFALSGSQKQTLRYGENPHQPAVWYQTGGRPSGWAAAAQLQGKDLSYNNLVDLEAARRIIAEFPTENGPAAAVLKHTNPCGVAIGESMASTYKRAFEADNVSAFGGIVALNQEIDGDTAEALTQTFLECVVAPGCAPAAREILGKKKNLRVLVLPDLLSGPSQTIRAIAGGFLTQTADDFKEDVAQWKLVTERQPNAAELTEMLFAWRVAKHVKSNAIVVTNAGTTVGIGAGQMNRVGAAKIALEQAAEKALGATLASDGFFPFDDSVRTAAAAGIKAIVQPGGSIRDQESIQAADELGVIMAFTGTRHFLH